jgi:hypothetical protein
MALELPDGLPPQVYQLGKVIEDFVYPRRRFWENLVAAVTVFLAGAGFFVLWLIGEILLWGVMPLAMRILSHVALLGSGVFLMIVGIQVPRRIYRSMRIRVLVFMEGLARITDEQTEVLRWDEVEMVEQKVIRDFRRATILGERHLIIHRFDGTQMAFDNVVLPRLYRLTILVQQLTLKYLLPAALEAISRGQEVPFGVLTASFEGIHKGKKLLPWNEVRECKAVRGWLTITSKRRWRSWFRGPVVHVDNVVVLIAVTNALMKLRPVVSQAG